MGELINGRTPEEIKRVLEWANCACGDMVCEECQYYESVCCHENFERFSPDALALIQHLEAERDAALKCVHHSCATCNHAMYRVLAEGAGCKTISVFCKEKECRDGEKWEPCEARMDEEDKRCITAS